MDSVRFGQTSFEHLATKFAGPLQDSFNNGNPHVVLGPMLREVGDYIETMPNTDEGSTAADWLFGIATILAGSSGDPGN